MRVHIEKTSLTNIVQLLSIYLILLISAASIMYHQTTTKKLLSATTDQRNFLVRLRNNDRKIRHGYMEHEDALDFYEKFILSFDVIRNAPPDFEKRGIEVLKEHQVYMDCNKPNVIPSHTAGIENNQTVYHFYSQKCSAKCQKQTSPTERLRLPFYGDNFTLFVTGGQLIYVKSWIIVGVCNFELMSTTASTGTENEHNGHSGRGIGNRPRLEKRAVKPERTLTDIEKEARYRFLEPRKTTANPCPPENKVKEYLLTTEDEEPKPEEQRPTTTNTRFKKFFILGAFSALYSCLVLVVGALVFSCMARQEMARVQNLLRRTRHQESTV